MVKTVSDRKRELLQIQIAESLRQHFDSIGLPIAREIEFVGESGWELRGSENQVPGKFAEYDDLGIVATNSDWKVLQELFVAIEDIHPDLRREMD